MRPSEAIELFQKLLSMSRNGGKEEGGDDTKPKDDSASKAVETSSAETTPTVGRQRVLSTSVSTVDPRTGKQQCLLPDHPVHAGCTSVVAVVKGKEITVANAGDSRAVLRRKVRKGRSKAINLPNDQTKCERCISLSSLHLPL